MQKNAKKNNMLVFTFQSVAELCLCRKKTRNKQRSTSPPRSSYPGSYVPGKFFQLKDDVGGITMVLVIVVVVVIRWSGGDGGE